MIYAKLNNDNALELVDEELLETFRNKRLSASLITGFLGCSGMYLSGTILSKFLTPELDNAATRGSFFHRVMEHLFSLPATERTRDKIPTIVEAVKKEPDFTHFATNGDALEWLDVAIDNYFKMGGKPERANMADFHGQGGVEVHISGKLPDIKRDFHGFIDKLTVDKEGLYIIDDWKTGAQAKRYKPGVKYEKGWPEMRQQLLYAYVLNSLAESGDTPRVKKARLIFPVAKDIVSIDPNNKPYMSKALNDAKKAEKLLNKATEENSFSLEPSFLCHWCPLVKICPAGMSPVFRVAKARQAYNEQPDADELRQGLEF